MSNNRDLSAIERGNQVPNLSNQVNRNVAVPKNRNQKKKAVVSKKDEFLSEKPPTAISVRASSSFGL